MIYLICTPIGNLNDISLRSIEILNTSDLIYAEDTRKAQKIFDRYKIDKKSFSFNDHNERSKTKSIINCLLYTSPSPRDQLTSRMPSSA